MESVVHLRKGATPRRLHADLNGLKDDEFDRRGFAGRVAHMYRRHDPTAYRSESPLRTVDVVAIEWKPSDAMDDETALFHGGSLYGIPRLVGLISRAPHGLNHGAPERMRERTRRKFGAYERDDWQVIAVDTRRRLTPSAEVLRHEPKQL